MGMRITERDFFAPLSDGQIQMIPVLLNRMREHGIDIADVAELYDEYIAAAAAAMRGARDQALDALLCPRCGAPLELQPLCPQVSPHWRTACACTADDCTYKGLSTRPLDYLLRHGLDSVEER